MSQVSSSEPSHRRIAFCITELDRGGAENALVQLVRRLDRREWQPLVLCLSGEGELVNELRDAEIDVECLGVRHRADFRVLWRLVKSLRRFRPEILQTWLYHANMAGRVAARLAGVPHVVSGIRVAERRSRLRLRLDRWTDFLVEHHACVSQSVANFSAEVGGLPTRKLIAIPNGVDAERFASARPADLSEVGIPADSRVLLFVGRLDPQKNPDLLLKAFAGLASDFPDTRLVFVGSGPLDTELRNQTLSFGLQNRVQFLGSRSDIPALMQRATVLVLPSRWEGMPNVVLEAQAAGLPVVASAVDGVTELIDPGVTGSLFESECLTGCQSAMVSILNDQNEADKIAQAAQHMCRKEFTWEKFAKRYDSLYHELVSGS
ncbi:glycosyltransferase [Thalassoroseus pseudoceratinae]|uniref:glycosyltransferase n=1 Tax=Thalassoroseus pseudoceratinae TaxID=2713176 RepID=UPI001422BBB3|nr:glycosyltransferase [Thalassoroseus pseudoceratinae]